MTQPSFTVKVEGARELRRAMKGAGQSLKDLTSVHRDVGQVVMNAAQAPVRTGRLQASMKSAPTGTKARVSSTLPYAAPIHWGVPSRNLSPNPWISRAAESTEQTWTNLYHTRVQELADQVQAST
jgi:hypothetical protein